MAFVGGRPSSRTPCADPEREIVRLLAELTGKPKHDYPACAVFRGGKCTCDEGVDDKNVPSVAEEPVPTIHDTNSFPMRDEIPGWENTSQETREALTSCVRLQGTWPSEAQSGMALTIAERQRAFKESMKKAGYVRLEAYVTKEQREKFRQLGGDEWLRNRIDRAKISDERR